MKTIDLGTLSSTQGFAIQGAVAADRISKSVSGAGDVNGDGYADIIIGAPFASPNGRTQAGESYVIFGKATGFSIIDLASFTSGINGFIIQGAIAVDNSGWAASGAGDINGDGYADIIIGALYADPNGRYGAGASYVIFGKASGFSTIDLASFTSGVNGFIVQGAAAYGYSGTAVSGAGDVNGDGYADIIISAPATYAGTSYVIFGKATGFTTIDLASFTSGANGFIIQGAVANDRSGDSVSGAGDVNGDGYADIIIGASGLSLNGGAGASYVIFGKAAGFTTINLASFTSGTNGFIVQGAILVDSGGWKVSGAGDFNGDGYADIIIGSDGAKFNGIAGASYVIFGKASGFSTIDLASFTSGVNGFIVQGAAAADYTGNSVSGAGDMNGDGYDDIIIGAYGANVAGASYVIFGKASGFSMVNLANVTSAVNGFIIQGAVAQDTSGHSVSGAGDMNGDGYADIIIGALYASPNNRTEAGESYVIFGGVQSSGNTYSQSTSHYTPYESATPMPQHSHSQSTTPISNPGGTSSSSTDLPTIIGAVVGGICAVVAVVAAAVFIKNKNAAGAAAAITTIQMNEVKAFFTEDKTKPAEQEECTELCGEIIQDPLSYEC